MEPPREFLDHGNNCPIGLSIAERLFSILQNNADSKAFFFI